MKKSRVWFIDDVHKGYNDSDKIKRIYSDLRKDVLVGAPVQSSGDFFMEVAERSGVSFPTGCHGGLVFSRGGPIGSYCWEVYNTRASSLAVVELIGRWTGYAHEARAAPLVTDDNSQMSHLILNLHGHNLELEEKVNAIIARYPRASPRIVL